MSTLWRFTKGSLLTYIRHTLTNVDLEVYGAVLIMIILTPIVFQWYISYLKEHIIHKARCLRTVVCFTLLLRFYLQEITFWYLLNSFKDFHNLEMIFPNNLHIFKIIYGLYFLFLKSGRLIYYWHIFTLSFWS